MDSSSDVKYYAWPSTVNVANFVTVKASLEAEGDERSNDFKNWKEQMLCLLESQDVAGFVNGEILLPPPENNYAGWRRTDRLVKGWILGSIGKEVLSLVREKPTARDVWLQLDNIFKEEEEEKEKEEEIQEEEKKEEEIQEEEEKEEKEEEIQEEEEENEEKEEEIQEEEEYEEKEEEIQEEKENEEKEEEKKEVTKRGEDLSNIHLKLYKAAQRGDWDTAHKLFRDYDLDITAIISSDSETALHVAVLTGKANEFVKKMVELMPREALALKNCFGEIALHNAAGVGNTEAAMAMIHKNPDLPNIPNKNNQLAVILAAVLCHKKTLEYLISKSNPDAFEGQLGVQLLNAIISSEFFDVALELVYKYPNLALLTSTIYKASALSTLAGIPSAFLSRESLSWWRRLIYYCIPVRISKQEAAQTTDHVAADIENPGCHAHAYCTSFYHIISGGNEAEVGGRGLENHPRYRGIRNKKTKHHQALELVNYLCNQITTLPEKEASIMLDTTMMVAAMHGVSEVLEVIMEMYPKIIFNTNNATGGTIFHLAAMNRFENVFSLIYSMTDRKHILYDKPDNENNNLMHICGKLAPPHKLNIVPGAALQMQRELQWFKEMENFVHPSRRTWPNKNGQTPNMVFTSEHQQLKADGEKWMRDTSTACSVAAALITTAMFTAAFNVPGGIEIVAGVPVLVKNRLFIVFVVLDAVCFLTSITSLVMFISILTSRYAEQDFLYVLPTRLSIGLLSLFISILCMLAAFGVTVYIAFRGRKPLFLVPVAVFAFLPVASFVLLQFPLLVVVVYSTYGPGIFRKKTHRVFY